MTGKKQKSLIILSMVTSCVSAQDVTVPSDTAEVRTEFIDEVSVTGGMATRRLSGAVNGLHIGQQEMFRAACCNLGESFVTNPSVDVNYNDAATGAQQIKLLGLSGTYVQMLTESLPAFRGAAQPFALSYVPGTWMKAISVSKGAASVKNGPESISGQIDIDYLKPDDEKAVNVNLYTDTDQTVEANADANWQLTDALSTNVLLHYQYFDKEHDENSDGFMDMPKIKQVNIMNRWKWRLPEYIMHAGVSFISEDRNGGQLRGAQPQRYAIDIATRRAEVYTKHAFIIDPVNKGNIAVMANAAWQKTDADYGSHAWKFYDVNQTNAYAQLMYETDIKENHSISVGMNVNYDRLAQTFKLSSEGNEKKQNEEETTVGVYAQYTYTLGTKLTVMAGLRADSSSMHGWFITPRAHVKYTPVDWLTLRLSAGKGYRTVHALAENHNLLTVGNWLAIDVERLKQEEARNYGVSLALLIPMGERTLKLNGEYYYTDFLQQAVIDYIPCGDRSEDANYTKYIRIRNLNAGESFSHVWQVDAQCEVVDGLDIMAAYRRNRVKCTYGDALRYKPLTSLYKALVSICYKTPLELWQFDVTLQLNGKGYLPGDWTEYRSFEQLTAQVTRRFRYVDVYVGGENLTGFHQHNAIIGAANPWSGNFDPTMIYAPVDGAMFYAGCRIKL